MIDVVAVGVVVNMLVGLSCKYRLAQEMQCILESANMPWVFAGRV